MKSLSGKIRHNFLAAIVCTIALGWGSFVFAQALSNSGDVCATYPHQYAQIAAATPTQGLVPGVVGKQIYVCAVHWDQVVGATPGLTLSFGDPSNNGASPTPCATASPNSGLVISGNTGIGTLAVMGSGLGIPNHYGTGSYTILGPIAAGTATPAAELCGLVTTTSFGTGTIEYVQR